jgi:hypothetical protein
MLQNILMCTAELAQNPQSFAGEPETSQKMAAVLILSPAIRSGQNAYLGLLSLMEISWHSLSGWLGNIALTTTASANLVSEKLENTGF